MSCELTGVDHLPVLKMSDFSCDRCKLPLAEGIAMSPGIGCSRCVPNIIEIMTAIATAASGSEP